METLKHASHTRPLLTQTKNNTTLWIGHLKTDPTDHFAGQTFQCTTDGLLSNIQIFADAVQTPGEVKLNLHGFDPKTKKWGDVLGSSKVNIQRSDDARWIRFDFPAISLISGNSYGFRLETSDAMVAIGEAASFAKQPFVFGQEWKADSKDRTGHFYSYFSLAFKVELCA
jgi:hypothetical protein